MDPKMNSVKEEHNKEEKQEEKLKDSQENVSEQAETSEDSDEKVNIGNEKSSTPEELLAIEKERVLRLSAEFDNYKKRKQREIDEFKKFANESVFRQILPVVDNLERAIGAAQQFDTAQKNADHKSLLEGVQMTHKEIMKLLETFSVKLVKADKQAFDPNFHQAVTRQESDEFPDNTVLTVLQNGYLLHDRLLRPAMVVVSKKPEEGDSGQDKEQENCEK